MSAFTCDRERRLWLWTLAVMAAIYSTLGLARTLSGMLIDRGLLSGTFSLGMFLLGAAIVALALRVRPRGLEIGVALGVLATYLLVMARMAAPEERSHLIEYGVVAAFIHEALRTRAAHGRNVPRPALLTVALVAALGWIDEGIQALLPNRVYDIRDVGFNALAGLMAVGASVAMVRARRWTRRRKASGGAE